MGNEVLSWNFILKKPNNLLDQGQNRDQKQTNCIY